MLLSLYSKHLESESSLTLAGEKWWVSLFEETLSISWMELVSVLDLPVSSGLISGAHSILPGRITDSPHTFVHGIPLAVVSPILNSDTNITSPSSPQVHREMEGKVFILLSPLGHLNERSQLTEPLWSPIVSEHGRTEAIKTGVSDFCGLTT